MSILICPEVQASVREVIADGAAALARCAKLGNAKEAAEVTAELEKLHDMIEILSRTDATPIRPN